MAASVFSQKALSSMLDWFLNKSLSSNSEHKGVTNIDGECYLRNVKDE